MARWLFKTQEQKALEAKQREERALDAKLRRECRHYAKLIPDVLARVGIDHLLPRADRPNLIESKIVGIEGRQKVKFVRVRYNEDAIYLQIDPRFLPYNHTLADLYDLKILETLSQACDRQVVYKAEAGKGCWLVVWRNGAINAIPRLFKFKDAIENIPANAGPLTFVAGVGENGLLKKANLIDFPHYLVAGSTGTGKSKHLNAVLCQLISRNTPIDLQFMMIDLKRGVEFKAYETIPHLWDKFGIVKTMEEVPAALEAYHAEMERRYTVIEKGGAYHIEGYNHQHPEKKIPYLVLVFDELGAIMSDPNRKLVAAATAILSKIMMTARAAGGHAILCTQRPSSDVIAPYIKSNAAGRICFAVPSNVDSQIVLDVGLASNIDRSVPGRAIFNYGPFFTEIQSPLIGDWEITQIVRNAIANPGQPADGRPAKPTLDEILTASIDNYGGTLHIDTLYDAFRGRITRAEIERLVKSLNGDPLTIRGGRYKVQYKGNGRHGGRRLVPAGFSLKPHNLRLFNLKIFGGPPHEPVNPQHQPQDSKPLP